jgi:hypothetical protein
MSSAAGGGETAERPEFMAVLGLLPPYTLEDVREAYRQKVLAAHPDRGGNAADFVRLSEAYDRALEYVTFRGDRRAWIAAQVEVHLLQEDVTAAVRRLGGRVEVERIDWIRRSWGDDFVLLADRLRSIRVPALADGDAFLAFLAGRRPPYLTGLGLAGGKVTDAGLRHLPGCELLRWLDVSGTQVTAAGLREVLGGLPSLRWLNVKDTAVGWWDRRRLRQAYAEVDVLSTSADAPDPDPLSPTLVPAPGG